MTLLEEAPTTEGEVAPSVSLMPTLGGHPCDQDGCEYVGKTPGTLGLHKWHSHRISGKPGNKKKAAKKPSPSGATTPRATPRPAAAVAPRRKSAGDLITQCLVLGSMVGRRFDPAVAAMVGFEAPIAGPELDRALAGTVIDKVVLQPAVSGWDRFETVGPLLMAPLLVGIVERRPETFPALEPMLRMCIEPMLPAMLKELKRQKAAEKDIERVANELVDLDPEFLVLFSNGKDPVDAFLNMLVPRPVDEPADG